MKSYVFCSFNTNSYVKRLCNFFFYLQTYHYLYNPLFFNLKIISSLSPSPAFCSPQQNPSLSLSQSLSLNGNRASPSTSNPTSSAAQPPPQPPSSSPLHQIPAVDLLLTRPALSSSTTSTAAPAVSLILHSLLPLHLLPPRPDPSEIEKLLNAIPDSVLDSFVRIRGRISDYHDGIGGDDVDESVDDVVGVSVEFEDNEEDDEEGRDVDFVEEEEEEEEEEKEDGDVAGAMQMAVTIE